MAASTSTTVSSNYYPENLKCLHFQEQPNLDELKKV